MSQVETGAAAGLLTRPRAQLDDLALGLLRVELQYAYDSTRFYRKKFDEAGVGRPEISTLDDLDDFPFTTKQELRDAQREHPPFGDYLGAEFDDIVRVHSTSGTTGEGIWEALSKADVDDIEVSSVETLRAAGVSPGDIVLPAFNYCLFMGGYTDSGCVERLGAKLIPIGVGQSETLIRVAQRMRATGREMVLFSTPSYATYLARYARDQGIAPRELGITKGLFGGEYGASDPAFRQRLMEEWGFRSIGDVFGVSEVHPLAFASCNEAEGLHFTVPDSVFCEVIDRENGRRLPVEPGVVGDLVLTHLRRRAQPLIRFEVGDAIEVMSTAGERCVCGRTTFRLRYIDRSDDMLVVQGVNVFPNGILRVLMDMRPATTGEFQIILSSAPPFEDPIDIKVETGSGGTGPQALAADVRAQLRQELYFTPNVEIVPFESLPRFERKTKRVFRAYLGEEPPQ